MNKFRNKLILPVLCSSLIAFATQSQATDGFVVRDIKITGLQRVSKGTVLNYLPVQVGEEVDSNSTPRIIRALYETGFFQSVVLERTGNTLIVQVVERSTIGAINVSGNTEIPNDKMKEILKELGLVKGLVFQKASLEKLKKELKQAYNARGKYNARITSKILPLTENRVSISVTISEGRVSRIKDIKIIGAHDFSEHELRQQLTLSSSNLFTYFSKKDQYSKATMDASLEALRSFYLDRGYLKFKIISSQVLLAPDRKDVFINIHIEEGPQYRFSGYTVVGKPILSKDKLDGLIRVVKGEVFSRKKITESVKDISLALGDLGYGFPAVNAEPQIDEKNKTVFINFAIDPGRHVYVRRINFHGNTKTADYVLRNVIRQNEGSLLSLHNIKESERQMRLISYIKDVDVKTTPIPGANNQVDLDISLEEAPSAEASASVGYGSTGLQFNAAFNQYNFMGTGRTIGLGFNASLWGQDYSFNYYNPFYTKTGIGRGVNMYYQTVNPKNLDVSNYNSNRFGGDVNYNVHIGEANGIQAGFGFQGIRVLSVGLVQQIQNFVTDNGRDFNQIRFTAGASRNTYDRMPYPVKGVNQQVAALFALPATSRSLNYYKASYQARMYQPLYKDWIFTTLGSFGYGNSYSKKGLPFFENYFAGGIAQPGQVRGYESYSLGPQDNTGRSIGANLLINGNAGLILPYPLTRETVRSTVFIDGGNTFAISTPADFTGTSSGPLRFSSGYSLEWRSPFGPLAFSVALPINKQKQDQTQYFQFTMSSGF